MDIRMSEEPGKMETEFTEGYFQISGTYYWGISCPKLNVLT